MNYISLRSEIKKEQDKDNKESELLVKEFLCYVRNVTIEHSA